MLPEKIIRAYLETQNGQLIESTLWYQANYCLANIAITPGSSAVRLNPQTLTGSAWRAAWAKAHEAAS